MNKPKEFSKTLKFMEVPSKATSASNICLKDQNEINFDDTKNCSIPKASFPVLHET